VLTSSIYRIRGGAYDEIEALLVKEYKALNAQEALFVKTSTEKLTPIILNMKVPSQFTLDALLAKPFEGRALEGWTQYLADRDIDRIMSRVKIGMVQGHSNSQIVQSILGTKKLKGVDGLTQSSRRELTHITRTATNFFGNQARRLAFMENASVYHKEKYVATLDSRTTIRCMSLDGNTYDIGDGPYPPVHVNCRSLRVGLVTDNLVGVRPFNATGKKQLLKEYSKKAGFAKVPLTRDGLPRGHKGKFDAFARVRGREMIGQVPAKTTYEQFLRRQTPAFQDSVLGKARGKLYREGKVPLERFVDVTGKQYTLAELAVREL
jgi:SPP1 gp7 family putative phage head morphogenesis protein